jgi:hypothetical protein
MVTYIHAEYNPNFSLRDQTETQSLDKDYTLWQNIQSIYLVLSEIWPTSEQTIGQSLQEGLLHVSKCERYIS